MARSEARVVEGDGAGEVGCAVAVARREREAAVRVASESESGVVCARLSMRVERGGVQTTRPGCRPKHAQTGLYHLVRLVQLELCRARLCHFRGFL